MLSLLLRRRKTYADVAGLLGIEERAVHDRAHAALGMLAPRQAAELDAGSRGQIGDYLLGQQGAADATATQALLAGSAPGRTWARALNAELATLTTESLPRIPSEEQRKPTSASFGSTESAPAPAVERAGSRATEPPSSRRAGALLLVALAAVIVVAIVLITSGGGKSKDAGSTSTGSSTSKTSTSAAAQPHVDKRFTLKPPDSASKALGAAELLSQGKRRAFFLIAQGLTSSSSSSFYVAWLYNSPNSFKALGRGPTVTSSGTLRAVGALPANTGQYNRLILTRETSTKATHPGSIVLSGSFK
ncbi:MAG TPA: hypothetical protein VLJ42_11090 [Solirubrobacteraceae bacterium]|nr:hypothetical protein [Solirubrobacteraceae bacterium]